MEEKAWEYIDRIDRMGGMVSAIEAGFPQAEIADAAFRFQRQIESGERVMVGVNKYVTDEETYVPPLEIDDAVEAEQVAKLNNLRRRRNNKAVKRSLEDIRRACKKGQNVMPYCIEAVKNLATVQEICDVYRQVYGEYHDPGIY
jgi:methylmalonyl-CoA mutase N-terminal domain/subunit